MARRVFMAVMLLASTTAMVVNASQGWTECSSAIADGNNLPYEVPNSVRICREGVIAISYDKDMIDPAFSMYYVTPAEANHESTGRDTFYEDPDLQAMGITQAAVDSKAFSDDWNRGHLAPSHILAYSDVSKRSCYTMANIAPQGGYFNQHPWEQVESAVATWIAGHQALYIITGVAYKNRANPTRTANNIAVPDFYWKIICEPTTGNAAGFFGVNAPSTTSTTDFVPVTQIESMYGGRLFPTTMCKTSVVDKSFWW